MVTCPNCKNQVFPVVEICPRCGRTLKDQSSLGPLAYVYALMVLIGILIWYLDFGPWGALLGFVVAINGLALLLYRAFFYRGNINARLGTLEHPVLQVILAVVLVQVLRSEIHGTAREDTSG